MSSPLLTFTDIEQAFASWRQSKTARSTKIPDGLCAQLKRVLADSEPPKDWLKRVGLTKKQAIQKKLLPLDAEPLFIPITIPASTALPTGEVRIQRGDLTLTWSHPSTEHIERIIITLLGR